MEGGGAEMGRKKGEGRYGGGGVQSKEVSRVCLFL